MKRRTLLLALTLGVPGLAQAQETQAKPAVPTLYLIGDSTVKNGTKGQQGWGSVLAPHFLLPVVNRALGGRSSRTFLTEGLWDKVLAELKPGDFVLMQFGHNDSGERFKGMRPRASLKGNGEETEKGTVEETGKEEVVHSYGWYLRRYIADARAKGATPIVLSPVPRNIWKDGKVGRATNDYGKWAKEAASQEHVPFIDLNAIIADRYDALGEAKVAPLFFGDHTHTSPDGALVNAKCVVEGIRSGVPELARHLAPDAVPFDPAHPDPVAKFTLPPSPTAPTALPEGK